MADDILFIKTGTQELSGWLTSMVARGVELLPSHFSINLTERYPTTATKAVVEPGQEATVYLGNDLILTGFIDEYTPSYDGHTHNVKISGRSNTEDVVDVSYWQPGKWNIQAGSLRDIVTTILKQVPLVQLKMDSDADAQVPYPVHVDPGESIYSVIEKLCRMCVRLLWDDEKGNLVISNVGTQRAGTALVEGQNVLAAATRMNWVERFRLIKVVAAGSVSTTGSLNNGKGTDSDPDNDVREERLKVIPMSEYQGPHFELAQQRANWEMNRRIGRSLIVEVHVVGWRDGNGKLWTPNTVVNVNLPEQKVFKKDLVIAEVEWLRDENGTTSVLTCMPAQALQPQPFAPTSAPTGGGTIFDR